MGRRFAILAGAFLIAGGVIATTTSSAKPQRRDRTAPQLVGLRAFTLSPQKYAGDRRLFVTISPNGDGVRDLAKISFTLTERATVRLRIARTFSRPEVIYEKTRRRSGRVATCSTGAPTRRPLRERISRFSTSGTPRGTGARTVRQTPRPVAARRHP